MTLPVNPYIAGNPVGTTDAFVGRQDVLRKVLRTLRQPHSNAILLFGQRRIGKTSVLQYLQAQLPEQGPYSPAYFDLQDKADWPLARVLGDLTRTIAHALDHPEPVKGWTDPETTFREEWLPAVLDELPAGCSLVLLFDEFDVLADPEKEQAAATFFPYLRDLLASDPERLQFVFVIGRNVDDLDTIALSLFKGTPYRRVPLLDREDTVELVRLSEANGTLTWPTGAVERVWQLTNGHPFLTQRLCSDVWEQAYDEEPETPPTVSPVDIDAAVPDTLEASRNTLEWLWNGLGPAERVVTSALAEAGPGPISESELEQLLRESGVRILIRELQNAPQLLQDWDILEPVGNGYRFRVELLRRWVDEHKPLSRVQDELDRIEPMADALFQAALGLYRGGQLEKAISLLRQAIALNPNHVHANQLLADILLVQGNPEEAKQRLEQLHEYQPSAARPRLIQALVAQARSAVSQEEQLALYERVLELSPGHKEASAGRQRILLQELDELEHSRLYQDALNLSNRLSHEYPDSKDWVYEQQRLERKIQLPKLYQRALKVLQTGDRQTARTLLAKVIALEPNYEEATRYLHLAVTGVDPVEIEHELRRNDLDARLKELKMLEEKERYQDALDLVQELAEEFVEFRDWTLDLERLERKAQLDDFYRQALEALRENNLQKATNLLSRVIGLEPHYKEAARYLHLAVTGVSSTDLQSQLRAKQQTSLKVGIAKGIVKTCIEGREFKSNPFFYGNPVPASLFLGRQKELRKVFGRVLNRGQSTAVIGEPRSGKTSLLHYLSAPEVRDQFYADAKVHLIFSYLDALTLSGEITQAQFWEQVLNPLYKDIMRLNPNSSMGQAYQICRENNFGNFVLERFLSQVHLNNWRLVLLLDELDTLLHHPILNSAEFFGGLRALASRSQGALALVVTNRRSMSDLNQETQQLSGTGSPYFNFLSEITLDPLPGEDVTELLKRAGNRFTPDDRHFISQIAGGHPYLLQVAASELWEIYETGEKEPVQRRQKAGCRLYDRASSTMDNIWRSWQPATQITFANVVLAHANSLAQRDIRVRIINQKAYPRRHLRRLLMKYFDIEELRTLCFDLDTDYDSLRGEGKGGKVREFIAYIERAERISELVEIGSEIRPNAPWNIISSVSTQIPTLSRDLEPELRSLARHGFVTQDINIPAGWRVRPQAFLWWLVEEIARTVPNETSFEEWSQAQKWDSLLTRSEKEQVDQAICATVSVFKDGALGLIEASARVANTATAK